MVEVILGYIRSIVQASLMSTS